MKALSWFYILFVAFVSAGHLSRNGLQTPNRSRSGSRDQAPQTTGCLIQGRRRPLFARRGQYYERQKIHVPTPKAVPVAPNDLPPKNPVKPNCSPLTQTCSPQSGCCDPVAHCHCHFFKAICFCRKTNSLSVKKS